MITFEKLRLDTKPIFDHYSKHFKNEVSELTFTNLYMWRNKYHFKYAVIKDFLWILNESESGKWYFSPPIGNYEDDVELSVFTLQDYLKKKNRPLIIKKAGEQIFNRFEMSPKIRFQYEEDRNAYDYLYDFQSLKELKGKDYHKKKNHVNHFVKTHDNWSYEILSENNMEDCKKCLSKWCETHNCSKDMDLSEEHSAIINGFRHFNFLDFEGGVIRIGDEVQAFTMAEKLNADTLVIHIEKANTDFQGLYSFINQIYLENTSLNATFVNREQDLGIEGLRKAKLSYHPIKLVKKYILTIL